MARKKPYFPATIYVARDEQDDETILLAWKDVEEIPDNISVVAIYEISAVKRMVVLRELVDDGELQK